MAYVIIGASGGLGRALADRLATDGHSLVLVARDAEALAVLAGMLQDRHQIETEIIAADASADTAYLKKVATAARAHGGIEGLLLPIGLALRDGLGTDPTTLRELAGTNFLAVAEAITVLWPDLVEHNATIVGFGSITGVRGRTRNFVYGAMKRALQSYFESLRLAARGTSVTVQFWLLGFLDSGVMAMGRTPLPKGDPERLADRVVKALGRNRGPAYFPRWWRGIALIIRLLPWPVYARTAGRVE